jgi:hypothetical protein
MQYEFFEVNKQGHTLKYEMGFAIATGTLCWCSGPWPGHQGDVTIARNSGLFSKLLNSEFLLGDKAYFGVEHFISLIRGPRTVDEVIWNRLMAQQRQISERYHGRLKNFAFTRTEWRHPLHYHKTVFLLLTHIVTLDTLFRPLDSS